MDYTKMLEKHAGKEVSVRMLDYSHPARVSFAFRGILRVNRTHYEVSPIGCAWIHFADIDIVKVWDDDGGIVVELGVS